MEKTKINRHRLTLMQHHQLMLKMQSLKEHIFQDTPYCKDLAKQISEDLAFGVTEKNVKSAFRLLWPKTRWPGREPKIPERDEIINVLIEHLQILETDLGRNDLVVNLQAAVAEIRHCKKNDEEA